MVATSVSNESVLNAIMPSKPGRVKIEDVVRTGGRNIIDIRRDREEISLTAEIRAGLQPADGGEKRLPTLLLYDEAGLKLFEDITYLDEYYLTNAEIELLQAEAHAIAKTVPSGSIVVELGSGNLRKVDILLKALDAQGKEIEYYALDLSLTELERTLAAIPKGSYNHVQCFGLHGTYDDGLEWLKRSELHARPKTILSLGSSIGNFARPDAALFLKGFADIEGPEINLLLAIDGCQDGDKIYHAYNDREGTTHKFIANGLIHANETLGEQLFDMDVWNVIGEYNKNEGRHQAFVSPSKDAIVNDVLVKKDEKVRIEESHKYDEAQLDALWQAAGVFEKGRWEKKEGTRGRYAIHQVAKRRFTLPWQPEQYASGPIPTWDEWTQLWELWDTVTREMIPDEELLEKPIKLRNACIFYLGHIPTFFDMKLADVTDGTHTEPAHYPKIFERGIDPDVDNPEQCHAHSEIPSNWPPLDEILTHQKRVRQRVKALYDSGKAHEPKIARCIWLGYEHEAMHLETLLYMLVQSEKTRAPSGVPVPNFDVLAEQAEKQRVGNKWVTVPEQNITLGLDDAETTSGPSRYFGWDIEKPSRKVHVPSFEAKARPITIGEYVEYMQAVGVTTLPALWAEGKGNASASNGHASSFLSGKTVRTVYGTVPLEYCLDWPVCASYDELRGCAGYMGGRIPTLEEARSIHVAAEDGAASIDKQAGVQQNGIPAVNGHLVNNGVEEDPPSSTLKTGDVFTSLKGANVAFAHWHPVPVTQKGEKLCGQADFGGVWEWTSSPLRKFDGYESMPLYPAYSADFFDEKHNIVLGGSWATVPRIAGRKTFVNWYQRNYPYAWAGARLVRDVAANGTAH